MGDVTAVEYMSLNGVVQAPGFDGEDGDGGFAHGGWTRPYFDDHRRCMTTELEQADAVLLGRRTYDLFASVWPGVTDPADRIAHALNTLPKYMVSSSLRKPTWAGTTVLAGDIVESVQDLRTRIAGRIVVLGSAALVHTLIRHDLIDEYHILLHPVAVGSGKRLFPDDTPHPTELHLVDSAATEQGLLRLTYRRRSTGRR